MAPCASFLALLTKPLTRIWNTDWSALRHQGSCMKAACSTDERMREKLREELREKVRGFCMDFVWIFPSGAWIVRGFFGCPKPRGKHREMTRESEDRKIHAKSTTRAEEQKQQIRGPKTTKFTPLAVHENSRRRTNGETDRQGMVSKFF